MARSPRLLPRLLVVAAAVMWSTSGLFVKNPAFDAWPQQWRGVLFAFYRAGFAALVLLPFVPRRVQWQPALLPMAACFVGMNICYLTAMSWSTAANAIWLQSTAPMWVAVLSWVIWKRRPARRDWPALLLCGTGIGLILFWELQIPGSWSGRGSWGVALGLLSGVLYAGAVMGLRHLRNHSPVFLVAWNHLIAALVLAPVVVGVQGWPSLSQWTLLALFGVFQMGVPYLLFVRALRSISSQEATLLGLLEPVLVPVWVHLVLHNPETRWWSLAGGGLILLGLVSRYAPGLANRTSPAPSPWQACTAKPGCSNQNRCSGEEPP